MKRRKVDWSKYRWVTDHVALPLWMLIALSCNIEPEDIDLERDADDPELAEFWRRLSLAMDAVKSGKLKTVINKNVC